MKILEKTVRKQEPNRGTVSLGKLCFYIFWIILLIGKGFGYTSSDIIFRKMTWFAIIFALGKIFVTHWTRSELVVFISLNIIGIAVWISSKEADILLTIITITACKDVDIRRLFKMSFWIKGLMFIGLTTMVMIGAIEETGLSRLYDTGEDIMRYSLGYGHPNTTHYTLFLIVALVILSYHKKMAFGHYVALFLYNIFIYSYTNSRTGLIFTAAEIIVCGIASRRQDKVFRQLIKRFGQFAYIIVAFISIIICHLVENNTWLKSFGTLSARFRTGAFVMNTFSFSLFGMESANTDFGFIEILYKSGVIIFLLYIIGMTGVLIKMKRKNMYIEMAIVEFYALYTFFESSSASILMNVSLFFLVWMIFPRSKIFNKDGFMII